jgi:TRAP-type C4-dicarboxylate transport system permease small subunit
MSQDLRRIRLDYWIAAVLLFVMALVAFVNILSRYLFHFSFAATEEITINLFVWMTVVGSGIAFERGAQLGMVTFFGWFPRALKTGVVHLSAGLSALLFILVDWYLIRAIYDELTLFHAMSGSLGIPVWIYYAGVPVLSIFVFRGILRNLRHRLELIRTAGGGG